MHKMKLFPEYFEKIREGSKRVEMRLLDEKRRLFSTGDLIEFSRSDGHGAPHICRISDIKHFNNFKEIAEYYPPEILGFDRGLTPNDIANFMYGIYCECTVNRCTVIAIELSQP